MANNPILFLDVDGVLNPFAANNSLHQDWHKVAVHPSRIRVWASKSLGQWLNELLDNGVRIVWATTWVTAPDDLLVYLSHMDVDITKETIELLPYEPIRHNDLYISCGKLAALKKWLSQNPQTHDTNMAWVDDELDTDDLLWASSHDVSCYKPHSSSGLSNDVMRGQIHSQLMENWDVSSHV